MRTYPFRTPYLLTKLFPSLTWNVKAADEKVLYLTFDDGPDPEATPYVLDLLDQYDAKATFFVVGDNVAKHPEVVALTQSQGHTIGNHTYHHLSGWHTSRKIYNSDVVKCEKVLSDTLQANPSNLFRPPYGRMMPKQVRSLKKEYRIIMWSLLSGDFDKKLNLSASKRALIQSGSGEVIVFHDSQKSLPNLKQLLPWFLESFHRKGYKFAALSPQK